MKLSLVSAAVMTVLSVSVMNGVAHASVLAHEWNSDTTNGSIKAYFVPSETQRYNDALTDWNTNHVNYDRLKDAFDTLQDTYNHMGQVTPVVLPINAGSPESNLNVHTGGSIVVAPVVAPVASSNFWSDHIKDVSNYNDAVTAYKNGDAGSYAKVMAAKPAYDAYFAEAITKDSSQVRVDRGVTFADPAQNPHQTNPQAVSQVTNVPVEVTHGASQRPSYEGWVKPVETAPMVDLVASTPKAHVPEVEIEDLPDTITVKVNPVVIPKVSDTSKPVHEVEVEDLPDTIKVTANPVVIPTVVNHVDGTAHKEPTADDIAQAKERQSHADRYAHKEAPALPHVDGTAHSEPTADDVAQSKEAAAHASRYAHKEAPAVIHETATKTPVVHTQTLTDSTKSVPMTDLVPASKVLHETATKRPVIHAQTLTASTPKVTKPVTQSISMTSLVASKPVAKASTQAVTAPAVNNYYTTNVNHDAVSHEEFHKESRKLAAGVSGAMALSGIPQVIGDNVSMGLGGGSYDGQSAVALGFTVTPVQHLAVKAGVSWDSTQTAGVQVGAAIGW